MKRNNVFDFSDLVAFATKNSNVQWNDWCQKLDRYAPDYGVTDIDEDSILEDLGEGEIEEDVYSILEEFLISNKISEASFLPKSC